MREEAQQAAPAEKTAACGQQATYACQRPAVEDRLFVSPAVEAEIERIKALLNNQKLAWMFENCFPNTLDTTVHFRIIEGKLALLNSIPDPNGSLAIGAQQP